jgi:hypothetical protein
MQDNPTTDNKTRQLDVDRDDWELCSKPYKGDPSAALSLGFNLALLRTFVEAQLIRSRPVTDALDLAMEALFPHTSFHDASFDLFLRLVDGKLTFEEEEMLHALGIKF